MPKYRRNVFSTVVIGFVGVIMVGACGIAENSAQSSSAAPESSIEDVVGISDSENSAISNAISATLREYQKGNRKNLLKQTCGELHRDLANTSDEEFNNERRDTLGRRGDFHLHRILASTEAGGSKFVELDLENAGGTLSTSTITGFVWELRKTDSSWKVCSVVAAAES